MQSNEILAVVESVSTEKGLDKDVIFEAIEMLFEFERTSFESNMNKNFSTDIIPNWPDNCTS